MNSTVLQLNLIIYVLYIFILAYIFVATAYNSNKMYVEKTLFLHCIGLSFGLVLSDFAWIVVSCLGDGVSLEVAYVINFFYFFFLGMLCLMWALHSEFRLMSKWLKCKLYFFMCLLPMIIYLLVVITTPFTKWFYYLEEPLAYKRGGLYYIINCIPMGYILSEGIRALCAALKRSNLERRKEYLGLSSFILLPFILWIIQIFVTDVSFAMAGVVLGLFFVYDSESKQLVTQDFLTKLNNRNRFISYATRKINSISSEKALWLYMIDLNGFKLINDRYGHAEGDFALCRFATVMQRVASEVKGFACRYGGDEFILLVEIPVNEVPQTIIVLLKNQIDIENATIEKPYKLSASIGCSNFKKGDDLSSILKLADESLYRSKNANKQR